MLSRVSSIRVGIDEMQFGFMLGPGATIHSKPDKGEVTTNKPLYIAFVDLDHFNQNLSLDAPDV